MRLKEIVKLLQKEVDDKFINDPDIARKIADKIGIQYVGLGSTRVVFGYKNLVLKVEICPARMNRKCYNILEYQGWQYYKVLYKHMLARTLWISKDTRILIMERMPGSEGRYSSEDFKKLATRAMLIGIMDIGDFNCHYDKRGKLRIIDYANWMGCV